jgi:broad specificity phosphatase PhoE
MLLINKKKQSSYEEYLNQKRQRLPHLVILLRHGESEGNADHTLWRTKPDNLISLTALGVEQSKQAGQKLEQLFRSMDDAPHKIRRVHIHVSPYERTLQTAKACRQYFEHLVVRTAPESRIREQEFGNYSVKDSHQIREQQKQVGRFWFRFPTGESGADVYDRIKSWWIESILTVNERIGYDRVDAVVVITHSLTMRFVLMQLYNWSPFTFNSVWNAQPCDMYILQKDLTKPGISPYVLDHTNGNVPESSVDIWVELVPKNKSTTSTKGRDENDEDAITIKKKFVLHDYLSIPPPRTIQIDIIKQRLVEQYPNDILSIDNIKSISFYEYKEDDDDDDDDEDDDKMMTEPTTTTTTTHAFKNRAPIEQSFRWNCTPTTTTCNDE